MSSNSWFVSLLGLLAVVIDVDLSCNRVAKLTILLWRTWKIQGVMRLLTFTKGIQQNPTCGRCTWGWISIYFATLFICLLFFNSVGRTDDVIMHSSGEKTVPGPMEQVIGGSSM